MNQEHLIEQPREQFGLVGALFLPDVRSTVYVSFDGEDAPLLSRRAETGGRDLPRCGPCLPGKAGAASEGRHMRSDPPSSVGGDRSA